MHALTPFLKKILAGKELSWLGTIFSDSVQYKTTSWHQCFILLFQVFVLFFLFTAFVSLLMHVNRFTTNHLINCKRVILGQIFIFNCCKCLSYTQNCKSKCLLFSHKGQVKSFVLSFCMLSVVASWSTLRVYYASFHFLQVSLPVRMSDDN